MPETERTLVMPVPPEELYRLIVDFASYPDFLEEVEACEILEQEGESFLVRFVARVVREVEYVLRLSGRPGKELAWELEEGFFRENRGGWILEPHPEGTRATYWIELDLGPLVPKRILNLLAGSSLPKTMAAFQEEALRRQGST